MNDIHGAQKIVQTIYKIRVGENCKRNSCYFRRELK